MAQDGALVLGRGARIRLEGRDDASGITEIRYRWDGGPWQPWRDRDLAPPEGTPEAALEVAATDRLGREAEPWTVRVRRDEAVPAAPSVRRSGS